MTLEICIFYRNLFAKSGFLLCDSEITRRSTRESNWIYSKN